MVIKNALVFTDDCKFTQKDVYIENGRFSDTASDSEVINMPISMGVWDMTSATLQWKP